jgi:hypothetical protein
VPAKPEPPVKGLGIAAGARRPGAKRTQPPAQPVAQPKAEAPQPEPAPNGEAAPVAEQPPVKGLGLAKGARPPGKR